MQDPQYSQTHKTQKLPEAPTGFTDEEAQDIYKRAAEIQSDSLFRDPTLSQQELETAAGRAGIDQKYIEAAIAERKAEQEAQRKANEQNVKNSAKLKKNLAIGGGVVGVLLLLSLLSARATFSAAQAPVETAQANVETVLQRRHDLLPNLISVTKATLKNQSDLIETLRPLAQKAESTSDLQAKAQLENQLSNNINTVLNQLAKSNDESPTVDRLKDEMAGAENRIAVQRMRYNEAAANYNRKTSGFVARLWRPLLGYPARYAPFTAAKGAEEVPTF